MIEFSSSLKLNEFHIVDSPFSKDPKNINFFQGGPNFGVGMVENLGNMDNYRDIYCYPNRGWSILKENISPYPSYQHPCDASIFQHARPNFRKKVKKSSYIFNFK